MCVPPSYPGFVVPVKNKVEPNQSQVHIFFLTQLNPLHQPQPRPSPPSARTEKCRYGTHRSSNINAVAGKRLFANNNAFH